MPRKAKFNPEAMTVAPFEEGVSGRPSNYRRETVGLARRLAMLGCTNERLASVLGVSVDVLNRWMKKYPDLREAIEDGRDRADTEVARSLYERATGYVHDDTLTTTVKHKDGTVEVVQTPIQKRYPPDVTACIFWLANRQRDYWRHVARIEHGGPDGGPIALHASLDLSSFSDVELSVARKIGLAVRTSRFSGQGENA